MVCFQTFLYSGFFVVITLEQFSTAFVAYIFLLGRIIDDMEGRAALFADAAAGYPADQVRVGNSDVHGSGQLDAQIFQDLIEGNSLFLGAGESIQDESNSVPFFTAARNMSPVEI